MYLTPTRYRSIGSGVDLSDKTDADLQSLLFAAGVAVNLATNAPTGYSYLGGHVDEEEHLWVVGNQYKHGSGRIWPYMRPLVSVDTVRINVTRDQYISFTDTQLFIQHALGYVEPVAAPNTTALFTSVPPWLLSSPVAYVTYDYGFHEVVEDELAATISGGHVQGSNQFWFTDEDVALKKDGVVVDPSDYVVDYLEGWVTPTTPPAGETYLLSYHHRLPPGIAFAEGLITTDLIGAGNLAAAGMLGLSGFKVEEVEIRQSSKINFAVQPVNAAAKLMLAPYAAMFTSMR